MKRIAARHPTRPDTPRSVSFGTYKRGRLIYLHMEKIMLQVAKTCMQGLKGGTLDRAHNRERQLDDIVESA
jgi:hypothetical protein